VIITSQCILDIYAQQQYFQDDNDPLSLLFIASISNQLPLNWEDLVHIQLSVVRVDSVKYVLSSLMEKDV
jgi:hypothetical protein